MEINIDEYISEEEKKEIAIDVFRQQVKNELFKSINGTVQSDSEIQRVIGNITHQIVFKEVQKYIPDAKEQIISKVKKSLSKDLSYEIFRKKDVWDKEEGLAVKYLREEIKNNEKYFKSRIKQTIEEYDFKDQLREEISVKFENIAESLYSLSELIQSNK